VTDLVDLVDTPSEGGQDDQEADRGDEATATRGGSAPVAIEVAIALPVSIVNYGSTGIH
jgi:hypothetical protein